MDRYHTIEHLTKVLFPLEQYKRNPATYETVEGRVMQWEHALYEKSNGGAEMYSNHVAWVEAQADHYMRRCLEREAQAQVEVQRMIAPAEECRRILLVLCIVYGKENVAYPWKAGYVRANRWMEEEKRIANKQAIENTVDDVNFILGQFNELKGLMSEAFQSVKVVLGMDTNEEIFVHLDDPQHLRDLWTLHKALAEEMGNYFGE